MMIWNKNERKLQTSMNGREQSRNREMEILPADNNCTTVSICDLKNIVETFLWM